MHGNRCESRSITEIKPSMMTDASTYVKTLIVTMIVASQIVSGDTDTDAEMADRTKLRLRIGFIFPDKIEIEIERNSTDPFVNVRLRTIEADDNDTDTDVEKLTMGNRTRKKFELTKLKPNTRYEICAATTDNGTESCEMATTFKWANNIRGLKMGAIAAGVAAAVIVAGLAAIHGIVSAKNRKSLAIESRKGDDSVETLTTTTTM
ncbi:Uncharacterised protein g2862 [Pycnogonum litorale]